MLVTLNGVTVFSHTSDTASYLLSRADPNEVLNFEFGLTHNLLHLPIPQMLDYGPIEPNVLKWPACASRFATLFLLIDDTDLALLRSNFGLTGPVATTLFIDGEDEDDDLTASMYMLPPRPLAPLALTGENGLWLLPLVDKRYFWWFKSADITTLTSWANLIAAVATALGVSITVSSVDADYGTPTTRFQTYRQPLPLLIDAIAYTIGMRFAAKLDGTYLIQSYSAAKTVQDAEVALVSANANMSGGAFRIGEAKRSVPDTVAVVFPRTLDGAVQLASYTKTVTLASLALTEYVGNGNVSGATNATPIVITTSAAHGLATGDLVTIASVSGNTAANGTWAITVLTTTTFKLDMSVGNAAYTSGGTWTNVIVGFDGEKTIMGDLVATFTTAGGGTPTNDTALTNYTAQAATDWYKWEIYDSDYHFGGIVDWTINGQIDEVVWHLQAGRATTRVTSGPYNDIAWGIHHNLDTTGSGGGSTFTVREIDGSPSSTAELLTQNTSLGTSGSSVVLLHADLTNSGLVSLTSQRMGDGDKIFNDNVLTNETSAVDGYVRIQGSDQATFTVQNGYSGFLGTGIDYYEQASVLIHSFVPIVGPTSDTIFVLSNNFASTDGALPTASLVGLLHTPSYAIVETLAGPTYTEHIGQWDSATGLEFSGGIYTGGTLSISSSSVSDFTEAAQDAVGAIVDATLVYVDATPVLRRAAISGDVTIASGSNTATITDDPAAFYDTGSWSPAFTGLTEVGGSATIVGVFTRIGRIVFFTVSVTGVTTTAAVAGTTYCDMPLAAGADDACSAANAATNVGLGTGHVDSSSDRIYVPGWTATGDTIIISGQYQV